ncbi:MAG: hypothetical protein ACYDA6_00860, partial [Solirubrobacteraceae bacterium]
EIEPSEPLPRGMDEPLLDQDEIVAELGLSDGETFSEYGHEYHADLAKLERIGAGESDEGFVESIPEIEVPEE